MSADASYHPKKNPQALYRPYAGTSMATPVVTGLVALYLQQNPQATPEEVKEWLTSNAVQDIGGINYPNVAYGFGKAVYKPTINQGKGSREDLKVQIALGKGVGACKVEQSQPQPSTGGGGGGGGCSTFGYANTVLILLLVLISRIVRKFV